VVTSCQLSLAPTYCSGNYADALIAVDRRPRGEDCISQRLKLDKWYRNGQIGASKLGARSNRSSRCTVDAYAREVGVMGCLQCLPAQRRLIASSTL
jgi:hypothetical protein